MENGDLQLELKDSEIDSEEVGRCSCGVVFYSIDYALDHVCLTSRKDGSGGEINGNHEG